MPTKDGEKILVVCIKNDAREDQITIGKEYEAVLKHGFYMNVVEIVDDSGNNMPIPTEYFKKKEREK